MASHQQAHGASLPFRDLRRGHDLALEGYFWRFSDPRSGRVIVALCGVCRDAAGGTWANVALATEPGGFQRQVDLPRAGAATTRYAVWANSGPQESAQALSADAERLDVDLGSDARLSVRLSERRDWATPALGGVGVAQLLPGLGQYWHPHLLGAQVRGHAVLDGETICLDGWSAYAEHNWGAGGFPPRWWWGQAQGFADPQVCVAFAGGDVTAGPLRLPATGLVVALERELVRLGHPLIAPVHVEADGRRWRVRGRGPRWSVELNGRGDLATAHVLPVPLPHRCRSVPGALEHLAAHVELTVRRRGRVIFRGESNSGGLEIGGFAPAPPITG